MSAGAFLRDAVDDLRARGVEIDVVSPASFHHFGIAYGAGIVGNLRALAGQALLLPRSSPRFAVRRGRRRRRPTSSTRTGCRRRSRRALTGKPFVLRSTAPMSSSHDGRRPSSAARPGRAGRHLRLGVAHGRRATSRCPRRPGRARRGRRPGTRVLRRTIRRTCSSSAGSPRRRACSIWSRPTRGLPSSSSATGRSASG